MKTPRHWRPLTEIGLEDLKPPRPEVVREAMARYAIDRETASKLLDDAHNKARFFINDIYQVMVEPVGDEGMLHINIRRRDGAADLRDWRHFQQIKNEVAGPEREAIELYPAESRKVDSSNKWHLWVLPPGERVGLGWTTQDVSYEENRDVPGMRQRTL
jgi:hypothetical protein